MRSAAATMFALSLVAGSAFAQTGPADPIADKLAEAAREGPELAKPTRRGREPARKPPLTEPAAEPATLTLAALRGRAPTEVRARLGEPALAREEGAGAFWTYRLPDCALFVFFAGQGGLKVTGAESGPLVRGGPVPTVDACLAGAKPA